MLQKMNTIHLQLRKGGPAKADTHHSRTYIKKKGTGETNNNNNNNIKNLSSIKFLKIVKVE